MVDFAKNPRWFPFYWVALALLVVIGDYLTPPTFQVTIISVIPICLASWFNGQRWGTALAIAITLARMGLAVIVEGSSPTAVTIVNTVHEIVMLSLFSVLVSRLAVQQQALEKEVRILEGMLPICMHCKRIRDGKDDWNPLEKYITEHSEAKFSHALCPDCARRHYGEFFEGTSGD